MKGSISNKISHSQKEEKKKPIILNLRGQYQCKICKIELISQTLIQFNDQYCCITCFAALKKWPYEYSVVSKLNFPVYDEYWTAQEQIYLFEGLAKHGFENWGQIADFIDTNKTRQDVEEHYTNIYLREPEFFPDDSLVLERNRIILKSGKNSKQKSARSRQSGVLKRNSSKVKQKKNPKASQVEIVGFMPARADFEFEYDNEAELLLAEMQFTSDDTQQQIQLKFKALELYNRRLTQRNKKKSFVMKRGLLDLDKQMNIQKTRPKYQKQIYNMMQIFSRYLLEEDSERLIQGLIKQKLLKERIQQYKQLHSKGFKTREEVQYQFERMNQVKSKKKSSIHTGSSQGRNRRLANGESDHQLPTNNNPYFSQDEINLCKQLKLSGMSYMMVKQTITREYLKQGPLNRQSVLGMFSLDKYIINSIIDYLSAIQDISCSIQ